MIRTFALAAVALIGIAVPYAEMVCNYNLPELAQYVKEGIRAAGGTPFQFNTVSAHDGITMGTEGMKTSLISRDLITDSIELMTRAYYFDALVVLCGCDKTIPAAGMALARLNIPGVVLYGGTIMPGHWRGKDYAVGSIFELSSGQPDLGTQTTAIILALSIPLTGLFFIAAVKDARANINK